MNARQIALGGIVALVGLSVYLSIAAAEDSVELLSGSVLKGEIVARTDKEVTIKLTLGGQTFTRKYPLERVRTITAGGKREVVHESSGTTSPNTPAKTPATGTAADPGNSRTREQVKTVIDQAGKSLPPRFSTASPNYPATLDMTWTPPPPGTKWNNQVNLGAFFWDVINPNPTRWEDGIKLLHVVLAQNQGKAATIEKAQLQLAHIYFSHLTDYARAAYWFRTAGADNAADFGESAVNLAECYYHLGSKDMAAELISQITDRNGVVKAWSTLGEIDKALAIAERLIAQDPKDSQTLMYAGDACRIGGRPDDAIKYYQRIIALGEPGNNGRLRKNQGRAQASIDAIRLYEQTDLAQIPDGLYNSQSLGYEGQVYVEVAVRGQRISGVRVTRHSEKQYYASLTDTPQRIIAKQSVKGVDTSNATITSEAIINATAKALAGAAK